jgi:hypothetical protein
MQLSPLLKSAHFSYLDGLKASCHGSAWKRRIAPRSVKKMKKKKNNKTWLHHSSNVDLIK